MLRNASVVFVCLGALALTPSTSAQTLDDVDVQKAIKAGEDRKLDNLVSNCPAGPGYREKVRVNLKGGTQPLGAFTITFSTSTGRIAFLAAEAKRLNQPFGLSDVSDELRLAAVYVFVDPKEPVSGGKGFNTTTWVPPAIDAVQVKSDNQPNAVVQPETISVDPVSFKVFRDDFAYVGKIERVRALASYAIAAVQALPAGDLAVVVMTQAGERSCKVGSGDRKRLLH